MKSLAAYTEPKGAYPAYVSVTEWGNDLITITVRSRTMSGFEAGPTGSITIMKEQLHELVLDLAKYCGDPENASR
jgi:hypothetical protein